MVWQKGVSGNPRGRPKQKTIKEMLREYLEENPDQMMKFIEHFAKDSRELAWQMLEGRPKAEDTLKVEEDINPERIKAIAHELRKRIGRGDSGSDGTNPVALRGEAPDQE